MNISNKKLLGILVGSLLVTANASAFWGFDDDQDLSDAEESLRGKLDYDSSVRTVDLQPNVELTEPLADDGGFPGFSISIDGDTVVAQPASGQRATDLALAEMKISISFDSLSEERYLNAATDEDAAVRGEAIGFLTYNNYAEWIARAEIRVYAEGRSVEKHPDWLLPVDGDGKAQWTPDENASDNVRFVLRVYDKEGRFDDTTALPLVVVDERAEDHEAKDRSLAAYGVNHVSRKNIPVVGGVVTANGVDVPEGYSVRFMGKQVPLDGKGGFVAQQILRSGNHSVAVVVEDESGKSVQFDRSLYLPEEDWFYVALADLTIGENNIDKGDPSTILNDVQHFNNKVYKDARTAFYVKGRIKGEYLLTASLDTGEQDLDNIFDTLDQRDPRKLFRDLDPDLYYTVYGDDSVTAQDAATQGRFYVRLDKGQSHAMWGNFRTQITGTDLAQLSRGLYGIQGRWVSDEVTTFGERRTVAEGFAAEPETRGAREEYQGTGGSLYYLRRRDITTGSERVSVQVRDKDTGLVISNRELRTREDYDLDPFSGRILLREVLHTVVGDDSTYVRTDSFSGHPQYLVVRYEYKPTNIDISDNTVGGRATHWVNDQIQVGITAGKENVVNGTHGVGGLDATFRYTAGTYVRAEIATTRGTGTDEQVSTDGGFTFDNVTYSANTGVEATAYRVEGHVDLADYDQKGDLSFYIQGNQDGFSGEGQRTDKTTTTTGLAYQAKLTDSSNVSLAYNHVYQKSGPNNDAFTANLQQVINDDWSAGLGLRVENRNAAAVDTGSNVVEEGARVDLAARMDYAGGKDWQAFGFAQTTLDNDVGRTDNNRAGLGGKWRATERLGLNGEVSGGSRTLGAKLGATYQKDDKTDVYLNYGIDSDRTDDGLNLKNNTLVTGSRTRFNDSLNVFSERRANRSRTSNSLTNVYGVKYTPTDEWSLGGNFEKGELHGAAGDTDRTAIGVSADFTKDQTKVGSGFEWRKDDGPTSIRKTWLIRTNLNQKTNPNWRFLGKLDLSHSRSTSAQTDSADFAEFSAGFAYRPIENDLWNGLFKYTYIYDLPTSSQISASGVSQDFAQRSHVLNANLIYDVTPKLSLGAKLGLRNSQLRNSRITGPSWYKSTVGLVVLRGDYHVVRNWDLFGELRGLRATLADDSRSGMLLGAYRHLGDNMKVGVGYNFTTFSDDITQLDYQYGGWFVNLLGKY